MNQKHITFEENGTLVGLYPMDSVEAVKISIILKAGSVFEGKEWGQFHLIEHLLHHGSKKFKSKKQLEQFNETHGISQNAYTSAFQVSTYAKLPKTSFDQAMMMLEDITFHSYLNHTRLSRELEVIKQEYVDKWSNQYNRFQRSIDNFIFGLSHPYTKDGLGQPDYIESLTHKSLVDTYTKFFNSSNMIVTVTGNIDIDKTKSSVKSLISSNKSNFQSKFDFIKPIKHTSKEKFIWHKEDVDQSIVSLNWILPGLEKFDLKKRLTIGIAKYLLASTRGIIYQKLREEMAVIYKCGSRTNYLPTTSVLEIWFSTSPNHTKKAYDVVVNLIQKFISKPIPPKIYKRAMSYMDAQTLIAFDSVSAINDKISNDLFWEQKINSPEELNKIASTVEEQDVRNLLAKFVSSPPFVAIMSREEVRL